VPPCFGVGSAMEIAGFAATTAAREPAIAAHHRATRVNRPPRRLAGPQSGDDEARCPVPTRWRSLRLSVLPGSELLE
jgi:hypothetical protein